MGKKYEHALNTPIITDGEIKYLSVNGKDFLILKTAGEPGWTVYALTPRRTKIKSSAMTKIGRTRRNLDDAVVDAVASCKMGAWRDK